MFSVYTHIYWRSRPVILPHKLSSTKDKYGTGTYIPRYLYTGGFLVSLVLCKGVGKGKAICLCAPASEPLVTSLLRLLPICLSQRTSLWGHFSAASHPAYKMGGGRIFPVFQTLRDPQHQSQRRLRGRLLENMRTEWTSMTVGGQPSPSIRARASENQATFRFHHYW